MKRWWLALAAGLVLCLGAEAGEAPIPVPMLGAVDLGTEASWIAVPAGRVVQQQVGIVTLDGTYQCCYAVGPQKARNDNRFFDGGQGELVWHTLTPLKNAKAEMTLGIAVPAQDAVAASAIAKGTQFMWRERRYQLTYCVSSEGMHLMLDGNGRRLRHYYYYLGYDTESDCDERELDRPEQPS